MGKVRSALKADSCAVLLVSNVKVRLEAQRSISLLNLKNLLRESFTFNQNQENMALSRVYCAVMGEKLSPRARVQVPTACVNVRVCNVFSLNFLNKFTSPKSVCVPNTLDKFNSPKSVSLPNSFNHFTASKCVSLSKNLNIFADPKLHLFFYTLITFLLSKPNCGRIMAMSPLY